MKRKKVNPYFQYQLRTREDKMFFRVMKIDRFVRLPIKEEIHYVVIGGQRKRLTFKIMPGAYHNWRNYQDHELTIEPRATRWSTRSRMELEIIPIWKDMIERYAQNVIVHPLSDFIVDEPEEYVRNIF